MGMGSVMQRLWQFLLNPRTVAVLGVCALVVFLYAGANVLQVGLIWAAAVGVVLLLIWAVVRWYRRRVAKDSGEKLEGAVGFGASLDIAANASKDKRVEMRVVKGHMKAALDTIKTSKLGITSGSAALYELPWYAVIGNPAAGKSSAVVRSGLNFPFPDKSTNVIQGIGGTRHCDWFFTTEGILLDTAGRYAVQEEDAREWLGFLALLKRYRPKAPLNGVVIAVSLSELATKKPEFAIELAKKLRARVQELTERLEILVPVYVVFTKADLISGFVEFFENLDQTERERIWGATLPFESALKTPSKSTDLIATFDQYFDELYDGLKEMSLARMSLHRGQQLPPGVLTFPLEFTTLKPQLRTFLATLFEDNPYQFRPVFRGFYFTSAVQDGESTGRASKRVATRFALNMPTEGSAAARVVAQHGFFLRSLFSKVIFADRHLVQQYAHPAKLRWKYAAFFAGALTLGSMLGLWTYSYLSNQQLVANVKADLAKAVKVQDERIDLQSRLQALEILQDRLEQLQQYRNKTSQKPWSLGLGLYQGPALEAKMRSEYFSGLQAVMLKPVTAAIGTYLTEVNANAAQLQPLARTGEATSPTKPAANPVTTDGVYVSASSTNVSDAYNALKTYIMLGDHAKAEAGHLSDQVTRFWRIWLEANRGAMPREQLIRSAEKILSFALTQTAEPQFPSTDINLALLDNTRENLRRVVKGMPARERVYAEIKARAALRYPAVTVARLVEEADKEVMAGSYAISGAFTKEAWNGFVDEAFKDAATKETNADDWVLKTSMQDDLTLEGSPEQIRKSLVQLYKTEYVQEWQKFMAGVTIKEFASFQDAVRGMNRLGDPQASPIGRMMQVLYEQTSWDNPGILNEKIAQGQTGFINWVKQSVLRMSPAPVDVKVDVNAAPVAIPMGPIGKEFSGLQRLMVARDNAPTLMRGYLAALSKVRTRFNQMQNQGDPGPASRQLMVQTLEGSSELSEALKLVDEQMLTNQTSTAKAALRPLLVRPLMQSFAVIVLPAESEINRIWSAQVHEPFNRLLVGKYPFDAAANIQATSGEIAKIFGPEGSIAKFTTDTMGGLVVRRGDTLGTRTWADLGLRLRPELTQAFPVWVSALAAAGGNAGSSAGTGGGGGAAEQRTEFQVLPTPIPGLLEYTLEIDGQQMRYRNTTAAWTNFVWPSTQGAPGVRITGITTAGQTVEFLNAPGQFGLEKMFTSARQRKQSDGSFELTWSKDALNVTVQLRLISSPTTASPNAAGNGGAQTPSASGGLRGTVLPALVVGTGLSGTPAPTTGLNSTPITTTGSRP
jgi:type VI secretion system protein ImpL